MKTGYTLSVRAVLAVTVSLIGLTMYGCIDEITFNTERSENELVVNGGIYDRPGPYTLELGLTSTERTLPTPVNGAAVTLFNGKGESENYVEDEPGIYTLAGDVITGERGETYWIEIELADGRSFSSIPETIPMKTGKADITLESRSAEIQSASGGTVEYPFVYVYADTQIPQHEDPLFLKWNIETLYFFREGEPPNPLAPPADTCYLTEEAASQAINIFSTLESTTNFIERQYIGRKYVEPYKYYIRHYFNVSVVSMTERRYNYWNHVDDLINQNGDIFDEPPAKIRGNIKNEEGDLDDAFGYFEAVAVDTAHAYTLRTDFSFNISNPCPYPRGSSRNRWGCSNCLDLPNSTLDRPPYVQ